MIHTSNSHGLSKSRTHRRTTVLVLGWCACVMLARPHTALAQATAQIPLQFDFLDPGARSLALGSAFVAVADDATAAFTNPAGLTYLIKPEVSAEFRGRRLETPYLSGGRLSGTVTNIGADTIPEPVYESSIDSMFQPYFVSFVYPGRRWAVAAYRHELVRQENEFSSTGPFLSVNLGDGSTTTVREFALSGTRTIKIDNYGGAVAYRANTMFAAGIGVAFYKLDLDADFARFSFQGSTFGPVDYTAPTATNTQRGDNTAVGVNVGLIITPSPVARVAAVYRQGISLDFSQTDKVGSADPLVRDGQFRTPGVIGIGLRIQPRDSWSMSVDYDRVQYSRLKEDFISFQAISTGTQDQLEIEDGNEFHFGVEYVFTRVSYTPAIRGGIWYDPDHAVRYVSDNSNSAVDIRLKATLPGGEDLVHYTFGFGMPLAPAFEFNIGADFSKQRRYASASVVARFGK